jgi:hypothetical protein
MCSAPNTPSPSWPRNGRIPIRDRGLPRPEYGEAVGLSWASRHSPVRTLLIGSLALVVVLSAILMVIAEGSSNPIPDRYVSAWEVADDQQESGRPFREHQAEQGSPAHTWRQSQARREQPEQKEAGRGLPRRPRWIVLQQAGIGQSPMHGRNLGASPTAKVRRILVLSRRASIGQRRSKKEVSPRGLSLLRSCSPVRPRDERCQ